VSGGKEPLGGTRSSTCTHPRRVRCPSGPEHGGEDDRIRIEGSRTLAGPALAEGVSRFIQAAVTFVYPDSAGSWITEKVEPAPSHKRHHPSVPQLQGRGVLAVIGAGRPGHLVEGGHTGSGHGVGGFSVASTAASVVKLAGLIRAACPGLQKTPQPGLRLAYVPSQAPGVPSGVIVASDGKHPIASTRGDVRQ
jgi:hypothetical protein